MDRGGRTIVDALRDLPFGPPGTIPPRLRGFPFDQGKNDRRVVFGAEKQRLR
ncbi:hypothetical protein [Actinoplanes sp. NBRC 103695]|uniref:hypothetical protein n=1 Tax=Actinoplanes sp. NBRC 103695 TaxID=3032202 RepID=UPI0024A327B4|nr:hypothetical protein [Actinoplanes sp. NBRC 103695]GLY99094.1 hypothetical protein Acsp02_63480 [Actinoplanes sp. NBRC 103695]